MRAVVTGAAGFIGSHLCEDLLRAGHQVSGVDSFTDYYDIQLKMSNLAPAYADPRFTFHRADLAFDPLEEILEGADVVWHQAGQPGVRKSWDRGFPAYTLNNVVGTQRILEAARQVRVPRVVYASSSSVYGNASSYPTTEGDLPAPYSPYGVTKLAAEHLCNLYAENWGLSTVSLRYFTVYGPRQRPDMAFRRLIDSAVVGGSFDMFGSGDQVRDFTFVADVVRANRLAGEADVAPGTVVNIAGGSNVSLAAVKDLVGELMEEELDIRSAPSQAGDVRRTGGSVARAAQLLGWAPEVSLRAGLQRQIDWSRERLGSSDRQLLRSATGQPNGALSFQGAVTAPA
jgi:UDP-glucuronate 4-epimerase